MNIYQPFINEILCVNNVWELLGSSGHSRRHHEGSGDKERQEERGERRHGDKEERRQGDREERRHGDREERERRQGDKEERHLERERRQGDKEERHQERERRQGDREVDKTLSGMEALGVSSDSPSTEVTTHSLMHNQDLTGDTIQLKCQETKFPIDKANTSSLALGGNCISSNISINSLSRRMF